MSYSQSNATQDTVAVFDSDFNQLFADARSLKVDVDEKAKLLKHPAESGKSFEDFRVIEPVKIKLTVTLRAETYVDTYNAIKQVFLGVNLVQVQTNTGLYANMALGAMPHKEDAAHYDTIMMTLDFEEVRIFTTSSSPLPQSAITQNGGNKNGTQASQTQSDQATQATQNSVLYNAGKSLGAI